MNIHENPLPISRGCVAEKFTTTPEETVLFYITTQPISYEERLDERHHSVNLQQAMEHGWFIVDLAVYIYIYTPKKHGDFP